MYQERLQEIKKFEFNSAVAEVFDDMISRSVPRYADVQAATAKLAKKLCLKGGTVVDLGCSTGTTLYEIASAIGDDKLKLIGVDNSEPMLKKAREKGEQLGYGDRVQLLLGDITEIDIPPSNLVILNYTLQFVPLESRGLLLSKVANSLLPGGALILTEKVRHAGMHIDALLTDLYYDMKLENHYSELEISQKREALEKVLVPVSLERNLALLRENGFAEAELYLKWVNFVTLVALPAEGLGK